MPLWMSDLKRLQTFTSVGKRKREKAILHVACWVIWKSCFIRFLRKSSIVMESIKKNLTSCLRMWNLNDMVCGHDNSLFAQDDLMSQWSNDQRVADLFTRGSHHRGISVLYLMQNLFPPGKLSRTISLNYHYLVIFRNSRDSLGISTLAKQMFPGRTDYLMESFRDATSRPYGYLVIDCHQATPENMRLRTNILPGERQIAYMKRT